MSSEDKEFQKYMEAVMKKVTCFVHAIEREENMDFLITWQAFGIDELPAGARIFLLDYFGLHDRHYTPPLTIEKLTDYVDGYAYRDEY